MYSEQIIIFGYALIYLGAILLAPILVHAAVDAVAHTAEFIEGLRLLLHQKSFDR